MKKLNLFQQFNFGAWAKDKQFMIQSIKLNDKKGCVSVDVIITEDNTDYGDDSVSNIGDWSFDIPGAVEIDWISAFNNNGIMDTSEIESYIWAY